MNTYLAATAFALPGGIEGLLIGFLLVVIAIAIIAGLIYAVETWIIKAPLPAMIRMVIGLIVIVLVIIWVLHAIGGGG
jgi:hypothetical protein